MWKNKLKKLICGLAVLTLWMVASTTFALPVFPGAEGFGTATVAGRGGQVIHVTTLADSGPGSLREAIGTSGARTIVFDVGGVINLESDLSLSQSYCTIAGQTAPGDGVMLRNYGMRVTGHDILIQHIAIRPGDDGRSKTGAWDNLDCLQVLGGYNVVIDHVSATWSVDENMSVWAAGVHDVTFSNNIIAEGLYNSVHTESGHSKGLLVGGSGETNNPKNIAVIKNLFAHNDDRNPKYKEGTSSVTANNYVYNISTPYSWAGPYRSYPTGLHQCSFIGNVGDDGPDSSSGATFIKVSSSVLSGSEVYQTDNIHIDRPSYTYADSANVTVGSPPISFTPHTILAKEDVKDYVLENAGSRPAYRDSVDTRIVSEVLAGTGSMKDHSAGLWPSYDTVSQAFDVGSNPNGDDDSDGYTNLEELLHAAAAAVEGEGTIPEPPPPEPEQYSTTFGSYSTGTQPSDWTIYGAVGSWSVDADTSGVDDKVLSHDDVSNDRYMLLWDAPGSVTGDVEVMAKVRVNAAMSNTGPGAGRVVIFGSGGDGSESGYLFGVRSDLNGDVGIAKYVSGSYSELAISTGHSFIEAGEFIWMKLQYDTDTNTLCGKVWDDGGSEPGSCNIQTTDTSLSSGKVGVSDWSSASKADYDFFSVGLGGLSAPDPPPEQGQGGWDYTIAVQGSFVIQ